MSNEDRRHYPLPPGGPGRHGGPGPGEEGVTRRRGAAGGPPPGGRGPFGFRGRHLGAPGRRVSERWPGGPGWPPLPGFPFADPRWQRGPRVKRGDVRAAALTLLAEEARNGYQIIQEIESRSHGVWRPSPGSIYPALQQLEDEGLICAAQTEGGRKAFRLTDEGHAYVAAHADELRGPWDAMAGPDADDLIDMRHLLSQAGMAAMQVVSVGTDTQIQAARQVLTLARRNLYGILASDESEAGKSYAAGGEQSGEDSSA